MSSHIPLLEQLFTFLVYIYDVRLRTVHGMSGQFHGTARHTRAHTQRTRLLHIGSMLGYRRRQWHNIEATWNLRIVFAV